MLYLAEVQKRSGGLLGGGKAELKLLACQRSEQSWGAVPGEDTIPSDEANNYSAGALLLVDISANKQVQRIQEAGRPLVSILQNFSRLQEKFKTQEEEIEQWKQSLTYQSQELNRREMEMESRREQLQQMEEDFEQLEQQRQEFETLREEVTRQRDEIDRNRQELEGAWDHLRGEMQRLEERQSELQQSAVLDDEQARTIQDLLNQLAGAAPTESLRDQLNSALESFAQQQALLTHHWQNLEQQRSVAQQIQTEVDRQAQEIHNRWQEWHQAQESLEQAKAELKTQQNARNIKQEYARMLGVQIQHQDDLHHQVYRLADTSSNVTVVGQSIDLEALEKLPINDLQKLVQELERDLQKLSGFVQSQEEELALKQQEIDALHDKIQAANEYDRLNLENELADEQDGYQMLNETLVGQRRSLRERESIVKKHQAALRRRQGQSDGEAGESEIDLGPILMQIETQRQQQADELRKLESQIEQMQGAIHQAQGMINSQAAEQANKRNDLKQQEQALLERRALSAETWGKVNLYQEMLQPIQDRADALRQQLDELASNLAQIQVTGDHHGQAIAQMRQILNSLMSTPELAAS